MDFTSFADIYLLDVFTKNEKSNLTKEEKNDVKQLIKILEKEESAKWRRIK